MTILSSRTAVVGLGTSCQTSAQIKHHAGLLRLALKDDGLDLASSSMFDNLIAPMSTVQSMLATGHNGAQIRPESVVSAVRPRWKEHGIMFWHDTFHPEKIASKYQHLTLKFGNLRSIDRLIFVVSNTQYNLEEIGFAERVTVDVAARLMHATDSYFGRPCEYVFVLNPRHGSLPHRFENARSYAIEDVGTIWQGNYLAWEIVFRQHFGYYDKGERAQFADLRGHHSALLKRHADLRERYAVLRSKYLELRERAPHISAPHHALNIFFGVHPCRGVVRWRVDHVGHRRIAAGLVTLGTSRRLEQLRTLEDGMRIDATIVERAPRSVDTLPDLEALRDQ